MSVLQIICFFLLNVVVFAKDYIYDSYLRTWNDAKVFCENNYEGLAKIITPTDMTNAENKASAISWIGLSDLNQDGNWNWIDGTTEINFWNTNEPSNDGYCVELVVGQSGFNDKSCSEMRAPLCNIQTSSPTTSVPTSSPSNIPSSNPTTNPTTLNPSTSPTTQHPTYQPTINPTIDTDEYDVIYGIIIIIIIEYEYKLVTNKTNNTQIQIELTEWSTNITENFINNILNEYNLTYCIESDDYNVSMTDSYGNVTIISTIYVCNDYVQNILSVHIEQELETDVISNLNKSSVLVVEPDSVNVHVDQFYIKSKIMTTMNTIFNRYMSTIEITNNLDNTTDKSTGNSDDDIIEVVVIVICILVVLLICIIVIVMKFNMKRKYLQSSNDQSNIELNGHSNIRKKDTMNGHGVGTGADTGNLDTRENIKEFEQDFYDNPNNGDEDDMKETIQMDHNTMQNKETIGSCNEFEDMYGKQHRTATPTIGTVTSKATSKGGDV